MIEFRLGRHNKNLIYHQLGDEPSDEDPLFIVVVTTEAPQALVAADVVETLNKHLS
jgi:hypothetical protein